MRFIFWAIACLLLLTSSSKAVTGSFSAKALFRDSPWTIQLLPGYTLKTQQGIDSEPGTIVKETGLQIQYDIGGMAGEIVQPQASQQYLWYQEQTVKGLKVRVAFSTQQELKVTFPQSVANFRCKVRNESEMAEALLIILSYEPVSNK